MSENRIPKRAPATKRAPFGAFGAPAKAGPEQAALPPRQPHEGPTAAQRLAVRLLAWLGVPLAFPSVAAPEQEKGADDLKPTAPTTWKPEVYGAQSSRLECTGVAAPVLFELNGPKDMGMHIVAPMGLHAVESALLRIDEAGALRIVLNLSVLDESDVVVSRHLNG